jgi:mRNA interferase MazF
MFEKDFDGWNAFKKRLHGRAVYGVAHPREVWWCALGANVGSEIDGKHDNFERLVLVLRVYNRETLLIAPMTSKPGGGSFNKKVTMRMRESWVNLTQIRVISTRRLLRKIDDISFEQFQDVRRSLSAFI